MVFFEMTLAQMSLIEKSPDLILIH